jgi:hypothetical protein
VWNGEEFAIVHTDEAVAAQRSHKWGPLNIRLLGNNFIRHLMHHCHKLWLTTKEVVQSAIVRMMPVMWITVIFFFLKQARAS